MYEYRAKVIKAWDGDTIRVDLDLGFKIILKNQPIRLTGINCPEIRGKERPAGLISKYYVWDRILGKNVIIRTQQDKQGSFYRWLGEIFYKEDGLITESDTVNTLNNLNIELLKGGLAVKMGPFYENLKID